MDIARALTEVEDQAIQLELVNFLEDFMNPAFGSLPKREIELRIFDILRNLGLVRPDATIYELMTELKVTKAKASQLVFDLEIRQYGNDKERLDNLIKLALIKTKFAKDGNYFVMEIENPLTLAHMRQRIREIGHISDTSFNSALVRAPVDAVTDLILKIIPENRHDEIRAALISAGAPDNSIKGVIRSALKTLGGKVIGEAADQLAEGFVSNTEELLSPLLNASTLQISENWRRLLNSDEEDG